MLSTKIVTAIVLTSIAGLFLFVFAGACIYYGFTLSRISHQVHKFGFVVSSKKDSGSSSSIKDDASIPSSPLSNVCSGDLILFSVDLTYSPSNLITGGFTMLRTKSPWTHVAVAAVDPHTNIPYALEFVVETSGAPNTMGYGLSLTPLVSRIKHYKGTVVTRALRRRSDGERPSAQFTQDFWSAAQKMLMSCGGKQYAFDFIFSVWQRLGVSCIPPVALSEHSTVKDALEEFASQDPWICTDIVSHILFTSNVFTRYLKNMLPHDFSSDRQDMPLSVDYQYDPEQSSSRLLLALK